jgi:DNA ligase (NAD+)
LSTDSRTSELRSLILKAKQAYYYGGQAIMTDAEYDALEEELGALSPGDEVLAMVGAPVPPDSILTKAEHRIHMGSQQKVNTMDEFRSWYEKSAEGGAVFAGLKADGASAAAYYTAGKLEQVITRGDGIMGEDVTANAIRFKGLPAWIETPEGNPFSGAVRFEVVLTVADWAIVDPAMSTNPRNLGSGIMGRKNGHQADLLSVFVFDVTEETGGTSRAFATEHEKMKRVEALGLQSLPWRHCPTPDDAIAYYEEIDAGRSELPFWIDGVVLRVDDLARQEVLGMVNNRPKGQVAWKFESVGAETVLRDCVLTGGRTGAIVPNARFDPVEIGGTTVSNALLNNWEEIARLDVAIGDRIYVIKANDIIPKVIEVRDRPADRKPIPEPTECPFCGSEVTRRVNTTGESGAVTICINPLCSIKATGRIQRWIKALDILGIGTSVLEAMVDQLELEDAAGLYRLHERPEHLASIIINQDKQIRLGEKRAESILSAIEAKRDLELTQFLGALGIERLGTRRAQLMINGAGEQLTLLKHWRDGRIRDADLAEQAGVPNLGDVIQDAIDDSADLIDGLLANGVSVSPGKPEATTRAERRTLCISGKLPSGKKKGDYEGPLAEIGWELVGSVTKDLDVLVVADPASTSSKTQKARKLEISIYSEDELEALIANDGEPEEAEEQPSGQLELPL